jgi:hypothetical protein
MVVRMSTSTEDRHECLSHEFNDMSQIRDEAGEFGFVFSNRVCWCAMERRGTFDITAERSRTPRSIQQKARKVLHPVAKGCIGVWAKFWLEWLILWRKSSGRIIGLSLFTKALRARTSESATIFGEVALALRERRN